MKVTVITICFNSEAVIKKTIESVLNQTYTDIEYIIIDGASKDKTVEIAESYKDAFADKGIDCRYHSDASSRPIPIKYRTEREYQGRASGQ